MNAAGLDLLPAEACWFKSGVGRNQVNEIGRTPTNL